MPLRPSANRPKPLLTNTTKIQLHQHRKQPPNPTTPMTDNYKPDQQRALRRAEALGWEIERSNHALDVEKRLAEEARTKGVTPADMNYGKEGKPAKDAPEISQKEGQK